MKIFVDIHSLTCDFLGKSCFEIWRVIKTNTSRAWLAVRAGNYIAAMRARPYDEPLASISCGKGLDWMIAVWLWVQLMPM